MIENFRGWHGQNGCGQSCDETLKLTVNVDGIDGID